MTRRRWLNAVVGSFLILLIAAGSFVTPGVRHTHSGGEHAHSHAVQHGPSHDHAHGHSHAHPAHHHPHEHPHDSAAASAPLKSEASSEIHSVVSHVHISFLGFAWVLPDFSDAATLQVPAAATAYPSQAVGGDATEIGSAFTLAQWLNLLVLLGCPPPDPTTLIPCDRSCFLTDPEIGWASRLRDAPTVPPPDFSGPRFFVA